MLVPFKIKEGERRKQDSLTKLVVIPGQVSSFVLWTQSTVDAATWAKSTRQWFSPETLSALSETIPAFLCVKFFTVFACRLRLCINTFQKQYNEPITRSLYYLLSIMIEIVVDVREHSLIEKLNALATESKTPIAVIVETLLIGDVIFRRKTSDASTQTEILLFERKSFVDLLASIKDGRYEEQSHRLIHTSSINTHNIVYVLEGIFSTLRNPMDKRIILSAMTSLSYFKGFSVFRTATTMETAELIWAMSNKIQKEFDNGKPAPFYLSQSSQSQSESDKGERTESIVPTAYGNFVKKTKHENITPENIGEILLSQIPGISNHIATEILKHFGGSFTQLIQEIKTMPEKLDAIYLESSKGDGKRRKLSSAVIQSILRFLV
jgi:ERCC4-type nuclease